MKLIRISAVLIGMALTLAACVTHKPVPTPQPPAPPNCPQCRGG